MRVGGNSGKILDFRRFVVHIYSITVADQWVFDEFMVELPESLSGRSRCGKSRGCDCCRGRPMRFPDSGELFGYWTDQAVVLVWQ